VVNSKDNFASATPICLVQQLNRVKSSNKNFDLSSQAFYCLLNPFILKKINEPNEILMVKGMTCIQWRLNGLEPIEQSFIQCILVLMNN